MRAKPQRHKPYGLLKQLPIPERPWNSISMDFIETLPTSSGSDSILVIIDRLTKQAIFIPTTIHCTSEDLAILFIMHVFSKHGVPEHVTSDRGPEFVSRFFRSLGKALDMKLHFTSGYHPEGDGQTERTNQTLEQYLRIFCNYQQDNWYTLLPLAEFAFNNTPSSTTGISPFFANKGYHPNLTIHPERDLASSRAKDLIVDLDELHQELKATITEAQLRYQGPADARRAPPPEFSVGKQAFVKAKFSPDKPTSPVKIDRYVIWSYASNKKYLFLLRASSNNSSIPLDFNFFFLAVRLHLPLTSISRHQFPALSAAIISHHCPLSSLFYLRISLPSPLPPLSLHPRRRCPRHPRDLP